MKIILAGYIALEATHKLITNEKPALSCRFSNRFLELTDENSSRAMLSRDSIYKAINESVKNCLNEDIVEISDMGIFGSLWEIADINDVGITIDLQKINIRQETIEICEWMNVNPYTYPSRGSWLIRSDNAFEIVRLLENASIPASVIGEETNSNDRIIINKDETRYLTPIDRLLKDEQGMKNYR